MTSILLVVVGPAGNRRKGRSACVADPFSIIPGPTADTRRPSATDVQRLDRQGGNDCEHVAQCDFTRHVGACEIGAVEAGAIDRIFAATFE